MPGRARQYRLGTSMVRRGSTVRVRQRAPEKDLQMQVFRRRDEVILQSGRTEPTNPIGGSGLIVSQDTAIRLPTAAFSRTFERSPKMRPRPPPARTCLLDQPNVEPDPALDECGCVGIETRGLRQGVTGWRTALSETAPLSSSAEPEGARPPRGWSLDSSTSRLHCRRAREEHLGVVVGG